MLLMTKHAVLESIDLSRYNTEEQLSKLVYDYRPYNKHFEKERRDVVSNNEWKVDYLLKLQKEVLSNAKV